MNTVNAHGKHVQTPFGPGKVVGIDDGTLSIALEADPHAPISVWPNSCHAITPDPNSSQRNPPHHANDEDPS